MVQCVFEEVSLGADEEVPEETGEVFAELQDVENLHLESHIKNLRSLLNENVRTTHPTEPSGHESCSA